MLKHRKKLILGTAGIAVLILALSVLNGAGTESGISIVTVPVERGSIMNTVTATGTVEPVEKVEIGTQVSGVVNRVLVDYNSVVRKGQLLAELDKTALRTSVVTAEANLQAADGERVFMQGNYDRTFSLYEKQLTSREQLETAEYNLNKADASRKRFAAELTRARSNLAYASIHSPINGVVLSRSIEEGQTVAASLNSPVLFTIARDLRKMQVEVNVDEADIGSVQEEQRVTFTVDAHPDKEFTGTVFQVRLEPAVTSNVVTYSVIVSTDNPDNLLMPGMTATVSVITEEATDVLTLSAKALRFSPSRELVNAFRAANGGKKDGGRRADAQTPGRRMAGAAAGTENLSDDAARVWVRKEGRLQPVLIKTGVTDGTTVEVQEGLESGMEVVVSMAEASGSGTVAQKSKSTSSPFMPQRPGGGRKK